MVDPILESLVHTAIGIASMGNRGRLVLYVLDKQRESPDGWVLLPEREAEHFLGAARRGGWRALRWLVQRRVLIRGPGRLGRGGAFTYTINRFVEGWEVPWCQPPETRRLYLRSAELGGRAVVAEVEDLVRTAALGRGTSPRSAAQALAGVRGTSARSSLEVPRTPSLDSAALPDPNCRAPARQFPSLSLGGGRPIHNGAAKPSSLGESRGGGNLDLTVPGAREALAAVRSTLADPHARVWGQSARHLEELLEVHGPDAVVEALALADNTGGVPSLLAALPELLDRLANPPELPSVEEVFEAPPPPALSSEENLEQLRTLRATRRQNGHRQEVEA